MTSDKAPRDGRTTWRVMLVVALLIAATSATMIAVDPYKVGMYFTLIGMLCMIWVSITNPRRFK